MNIENEKFMAAVKKCLNDQCDEKCFMYEDCDNCHYHLLDEIMFRMGVLPEDYIDWLVEKVKEAK